MDPEFINDLFAPFGPVTVRRMFGGAGIYREGLMFALVFDGAIFLKVDDASKGSFVVRVILVESFGDEHRMVMILGENDGLSNAITVCYFCSSGHQVCEDFVNRIFVE